MYGYLLILLFFCLPQILQICTDDFLDLYRYRQHCWCQTTVESVLICVICGKIYINIKFKEEHEQIKVVNSHSVHHHRAYGNRLGVLCAELQGIVH